MLPVFQLNFKILFHYCLTILLPFSPFLSLDMNVFSSLVLFGEGFLTGLTLTIMLGPVTMIILKYGMQVDRLAGVWAAAGTWASDFVFIGITFWLTTSITMWWESPSVKFWMYVVSGFGLFVFGLSMVRKRKDRIITAEGEKETGYVRAFLAGLVVNTLSPVTLFFWLGVAIFLHMQTENPAWYYSGVMLSLAFGDFMKAWLAPKLAMGIKGKYVYWVQIVAGILIAISGLYMIGYGYLS